MELLSRFRNLTVLLLVIFAQLVLLAYQVKSNQDVRLIRVWAVTAVTPLARIIEGARSNVARALNNYVFLRNLAGENRRLTAELGRLKLENQYLKSELATAERAQALSAFQAKSPSRTIAARVIGAGAGAGSKVVFVDRGSASGVMKGMAVINPDGILGKVIAAYPTAAQVLLITDPTFAAGVVSEKHRVRGTVKGQGHAACRVDYIPAEDKVEAGELFYTSGDDRVFPRGLPVGTVTAVRSGNPFQQISLNPTGLRGGLEEVLIVLEAVHLELPESRATSADIHLLAPPPAGETVKAQSPPLGGAATEADRLRERYKAIGEAQGHKFGEGLPGSKPPDFNLDPAQAKPEPAGEKPAAPPPQAGSTKPGPQL
ncbi:MAG: rod shape-determining protein MreC [Acidobacteriota bacterium]